MANDETVKGYVDEEMKRQLKRLDESQSEAIRNALSLYLGTQSEESLENELREVIKDYKYAKGQREDWDKEVRNTIEEIHGVARELHEFQDPEAEYENWLEGVLDTYQKDDHPLLIPSIINNYVDGSDNWEKTASEIRGDLKRVAVEQKRDLGEVDFTQGHQTGSDTPLWIEYKVDENGGLTKRGKNERQERQKEWKENRKGDRQRSHGESSDTTLQSVQGESAAVED